MVLSKQVFTPQTFLEVITGKCYIINDSNDIEFIHEMLVDEGFEDDDSCTLWDYPLDEIGEIVENEVDVVLVECCYFDDDDILQKEYRWFEVPEECVSRFKEENAEYTPSAENGDYSPSNPWDAPGMKMSDFI
jgi:hypothetical protein